MTTDEARLMLIAFLTSEKLPIPTSGIISSVVPGLTDIWAEALKLTVNARALIVGPGIKTGMQMRYNDPAEVGSDRIADCVAARAKHGSPVLVVDLGVSTNIMVVGDDGAFLGGLLAPGLALAARALFGAAARLPVVELTKPTTVIGKNTGDAMRSGLVLGEAARINGLIELIWEELGYQTKIVVTGSEAKAIASLLKYEVLVEPDLTLYGLMLLHQKNRH
jgi:type III pantothenate kinase